MWLAKIAAEVIEDPTTQMTLAQAREINPKAQLGDEVRIPLEIAEFGRNAIQAAKQVLCSASARRTGDGLRRVTSTRSARWSGRRAAGRPGERDRQDQPDRGGHPARELINRDRFRQRDHARAYVLMVDKQSKGPQVILSRTHPNFLVKLFEAEVPEIAEGIVEIKSVAREAGHRSKIAVYSRDDRIDAVGACVGIKGSRVQAIVRELGGERIDIVPWSSDPVLFVSRALNPAKVLQASIDEGEHKITVTVDDEQLSLAIGKGGQNARLAAKLTAWNIDLISAADVAARKQAESKGDVPVEELDGLTPKLAQKLVSAGIETANEVGRAGLEGLLAVEGIGEKTAEKILASAVAALAAAQAAAEAESAAAAPAEDFPPRPSAGDERRPDGGTP